MSMVKEHNRYLVGRVAKQTQEIKALRVVIANAGYLICDWCLLAGEGELIDKIHLNRITDSSTGKLVDICDGCLEASEP